MNELEPILTSATDSKYELKDGTILTRMNKKKFETIYYNMQTNKNGIEKFIKQLQEPNFNISID
jgi:predicted choloylglycine hydrolase